MVQQLTIFDALLVKRESFAVGDTVEVDFNVEERRVEDYYYLQDHAGLKGRIVKLLSLQQYEVRIAKRERLGIFRQNELIRSE